MLGLSPHEVLEYLLTFDQSKPLPKKVHELLIGYLFVQFLNDQQRESSTIGFPAAEGWNAKCSEKVLTLDYLLEHQEELISDTDVDIQISSIVVRKFQITRFVHPGGRSAHRRLAELIAKKCRHQQPDKHLNLLVSIERTPNISEDELRTLLTETNIPFAGIFLIMKASADRGHVSFCRLYPNPIIIKEKRVSLPL